MDGVVEKSDVCSGKFSKSPCIVWMNLEYSKKIRRTENIEIQICSHLFQLNSNCTALCRVKKTTANGYSNVMNYVGTLAEEGEIVRLENQKERSAYIQWNTIRFYTINENSVFRT